MDLQLRLTRIGPDAVLAAEGEIDLTTSELLRDELSVAEQSEPEGVVIDLTAVDFVDSTGLSVLVAGAQRSHASGRSFGIVADGHLRELLRMTGLDTVMTVHRSLESALGSDPAGDEDAPPT